MIAGWQGGRISAMRRSLLVVLALLPAGCAAPVRQFGAPTAALPGAAGERGFVAVTSDWQPAGSDATVVAAVRDALTAAGYRQSNAARYRIEVGFAIRASRIGVTTPTGAGGTAVALTPRAPTRLALCPQRNFALSIAFVDRVTGHVVARGGAVTRRCRNIAAAVVLPSLARSALMPLPHDASAS